MSKSRACKKDCNCNQTVWYKLNCNDLNFTSEDSTVVITKDGCNFDLSVDALAGSGTVTSVGLTVPSGLSVSNSPVTTSGVINISTTLNGPIRGTGSGFTVGQINLASEVLGALAITNG